MSESQFEAGRVKFDQHLGPCVGDWYEMNDGCRRRFGRDLGESLQLAADPSGRYISLGADGNATYNGPLLDRIIQKSSLGKPLDHDGAVRLIMCSRPTAVSSKKDDGVVSGVPKMTCAGICICGAAMRSPACKISPAAAGLPSGREW